MDTVEELNSTYFYAGRSNLTASQLLFMIFCENTANQLGVQDFGAIVSIVAGLNVLPTRTKPRGAKHLLNPFRKNDIPQAPEFTIGMLIASAGLVAGCMTDSRLGLLSVLHHHGAHNVYYVKCTRTIKRHVKAAGFVHVKNFWPISLILPAVTLREFC